MRVSEKPSLLFFTFASLVISTSQANDSVEVSQSDEYYEDLYIKPLSDGKLFAQFQFETVYRKDFKNLRWENKFEIFPLSLADLVLTTDLNELHFSLTKGNWNYRNWGFPMRSSPPGAQIRVKFAQHNENRDRSWTRLVNSLSGKFCASIASADEKTRVTSKLAFNHYSSNSSQPTLYANLPEENFCTENLTPWKKLLPCHSKSGLASLLNAVNLLKSSYSSLAIDLQPKPCESIDGQPLADCEKVQLIQSISLIFDPLNLFEGKQIWSLIKIFGAPIKKTCPVAKYSRVHVETTELDDKSKIYPQSFTERELKVISSDNPLEKRTFATFDLNSILNNSSPSPTSNLQFNVGMKQTKLFKRPLLSTRPVIPIHFNTHVAGIGASEGNVVATITNNLKEKVRVTYMHLVPHLFPVYLHTLTIRTKLGEELKPENLNFVISKDAKPALIELTLVIPANSEVRISYDFERAFFRWTEYKPDANKGFLMGSASLAISIAQPLGLKHVVFPVNTSTSSSDYELYENSEVFRLYARPLLIIIPTPDFSMPYNVVCLVCSVLAAAFGPLHSMTTNKPVIKISKKKEAESKKDK